MVYSLTYVNKHVAPSNGAMLPKRLIFEVMKRTNNLSAIERSRPRWSIDRNQVLSIHPAGKAVTTWTVDRLAEVVSPRFRRCGCKRSQGWQFVRNRHAMCL